MAKLIIQIPCFNEADTLPGTLADLPRTVPGFDEVEWLVIDDGSDDGTADVARAAGVDHVVRITRNRGLAKAFTHGLEHAITLGADVIVNTDGDNQYNAADIPKLVRPILAGHADMVVGARPIRLINHFSPLKKILQHLGSWIVRWVSRTDIPDAPSGFRAFSRRAAMELKVFNEYSYTLETIIQAGHKGIAVASVPVSVNAPTRPSRLVRSLPGYLARQLLTVIRIFMTYRPFLFFAVPGALSFAAGSGLGGRFLYYYAHGDGSGHVQSLLLAALLLGAGFLLVVVGLLADLAAVNRKLLEGVDARLHRMEERITMQRAPDSPGPVEAPHKPAKDLRAL